MEPDTAKTAAGCIIMRRIIVLEYSLLFTIEYSDKTRAMHVFRNSMTSAT